MLCMLPDNKVEKISNYLTKMAFFVIFRRLSWDLQELVLGQILPKAFWPIFSIHCSAKRPVNQVHQGLKSNLLQEMMTVSILFLFFAQKLD